MRLELATFLAAAVVVSGCTGSSVSEPEGDFNLYVSDSSGGMNFSSLEISIGEARVFLGNFSDGEEQGFKTLKVNETVDLATIGGEKGEQIIDTELEPGTYNRVEIHTGDIIGVVENQSVDLKVPSEEKLEGDESFEIAVNETTELVFNIDVMEEGEEEYSILSAVTESEDVEDRST